MGGDGERDTDAAAVIQSLIDILEGPDAEWLTVEQIRKQRATIEQAKLWLRHIDGGAS